jgi:hypothetical protein
MATDAADPHAGDGPTPGRRAQQRRPADLPSAISSSAEPGANDTGAMRSGFTGAQLARLVRRQAKANARRRRGDGSS